MGAISVVLIVSAGLIHVLLRLDRAGRAHVAEAANLGRLAREFRRDVRAATVEEYGAAAPPPPLTATVYFRGTDERVGPIIKYATVEPHGHA